MCSVARVEAMAVRNVFSVTEMGIRLVPIVREAGKKTAKLAEIQDR